MYRQKNENKTQRKKEYIFQENAKELVKIWLDYANETSRNQPKKSVDEDTAKFIMHTCEMLKLERDVFFMSVDMIGKYLRNLEIEASKIKEPILAAVVIILICNKLVGQRLNMTITTIYLYLHKLGIKKYTKFLIENSEIEVMTKLKFDFPLTSSMDDLNALIEVFLIPTNLPADLRPQCMDVLNMVYLHYQKITDILEEIYKRNEATQILATLYMNNLYFPTGVLLTVLKMCEVLNIINFKKLCTEISTYTKVSTNDLILLAKIIYQLIFIKIHSDKK